MQYTKNWGLIDYSWILAIASEINISELFFIRRYILDNMSLVGMVYQQLLFYVSVCMLPPLFLYD
jgi:hypothetical protein